MSNYRNRLDFSQYSNFSATWALYLMMCKTVKSITSRQTSREMNTRKGAKERTAHSIRRRDIRWCSISRASSWFLTSTGKRENAEGKALARFVLSSGCDGGEKGEFQGNRTTVLKETVRVYIRKVLLYILLLARGFSSIYIKRRTVWCQCFPGGTEFFFWPSSIKVDLPTRSLRTVLLKCRIRVAIIFPSSE